MVDKITLIPESIRAYGNVLLEDRDINDYKGHKSALFENVAVINGETFRVFHNVYSEYTVGFNFNLGTKELYVSTDDDTVITDFSFDSAGKELEFESTLFSFHNDDVLKELYVTDEDVPVVVYSLEFEESSYIASGGVATVSAVLLGDGEPVSGATVTFTSSASTAATATTDSTGIATATITFSESTTLTASYQDVSDTCTVTVGPSYLFYDACDSASGLSNYGQIIPISSSTTTSQLEYNSTQNAYYVHANGDWGIIPITALNGKDNYKITAEVKTKSSGNTYQGGIGFIAQTGTSNIIFRKYNTNCNSALNGGNNQESIGTIRLADEQWHKFEITKQGQTYTVTVTDMGNSTVVGTQTRTVTFDTYYVGFMTVAGTSYGSYVRNIKAEYL